jgi:ribA/ribD-fused uncharacterized protein
MDSTEPADARHAPADALAARTVEELMAATDTGEHPSFLFFFGRGKPGTDPQGFVLSQWYGAPFTDEKGHEFATAEHYMMWRKAVLFGDHDTAGQVLTAPSPKAVKALGRQVRDFDEDTWVRHRWDIVVDGSVLKFTADPRRTAYLASTTGQILVEASPYDRIWGIGLPATSPQATDPRRWRGLNVLGFALMEARSRLAA